MAAPMRDLGAERMAELGALGQAHGPKAVPLPGGWIVRKRRGRIFIEPPGGAVEMRINSRATGR